jgi:hypothetical protein
MKALQDELPVFSIDDADLDREFRELPATIARWNHLYAVAVRECLQSDLDLERMEAVATAKVRDSFVGKQMTVNEMKARLLAMDEFQAARQRVVDAESTKYEVRGVCEALEAKRWMLQSLGARQRVEMERDPVVRRRD